MGDSEVAQRAELFTRLLKSLPVVFFSLDADGVFMESLGAGLKRLDLKPGQVVGMNALEMFGVSRPQLERALNGEAVSYETSGELNGQPWSFLTFVTPNPTPNTGIVGFGIDTTELLMARTAEEQVRAQIGNVQKLESLGVLAGGIAHDFNNLLTSMLGHASLGLMKLAPGTAGREELVQIEQAAQTAAALCKQLLAYSGKGQFVVRPINLSQLCNDTVRLLKVTLAAGATLRVDCPLDIPIVVADSPQMQQILMNLVLNAAESLGGPGVVSLSTGTVFCDTEYFKTSYLMDELEAGEYVFVQVSDTGCGMDVDTRAKLFEPFFSTKQTGRGLGLAAVLGIVRGHSGAIQVDSEPGRGTTIKVLFPVRAAQEITKVKDAPAPKVPRPSTVLLADDNLMVQDVARAILENAGYRVILACDGKEAIDVFSSRSDIDIIVLDMTMPNMSGSDAFEELQRLGATVPVLLSSGYSEKQVASKYMGADQPGFLEKPYRAHELLSAVERMLS
ncbi:MAG: two-component system cell cycle sensor histidine kinase/response regulator CckA [Myxococcota bacterium]|jgi:two-component system cell cycle sensor histidine kinase/response regulator CckA